MPRTKIPTRLLSAFCKGKRPVGKPNCITRHYFYMKFVKLFHLSGSFNTLVYATYDKLTWILLNNNLKSYSFTATPEWYGEIHLSLKVLENFAQSPPNTHTHFLPPLQAPSLPSPIESFDSILKKKTELKANLKN